MYLTLIGSSETVCVHGGHARFISIAQGANQHLRECCDMENKCLDPSVSWGRLRIHECSLGSLHSTQMTSMHNALKERTARTPRSRLQSYLRGDELTVNQENNLVTGRKDRGAVLRHTRLKRWFSPSSPQITVSFSKHPVLLLASNYYAFEIHTIKK